jgi:hypothetical protein
MGEPAHLQHRSKAAAPVVPDGLLRRLLEVCLGGWPLPKCEATAERILLRADQLGVFPLLYQYLRAAGLPLAPSQHHRWRTHVIRIALLSRRLQRVVQALQDLEHAVLKGLPLAVAAYGDVHARSVGDVDILVRASDVPRAQACLEAAGYAAAPGARPWFGGNNQFALYHSGHGLAVELHWAMAMPSVPSPSADELLRSRASVLLDSRFLVTTLDAQAGLLSLVLHYHHHVGFVGGLFDIAAWLDRQGPALDPGAVRETCRRLGIYGVLQWPMHVLRSLTGKAPQLLGEDVEPQVLLWSRCTAARMRSCLAADRYPGLRRSATTTHGALLGRRMAWRLLSASLLDGFRAKAVGVLQPVFHGPRAHAEYRGEPRVTFGTYVHMALRPYVLARKRWARMPPRDS